MMEIKEMISIGKDININPNVNLLKPQVNGNITIIPLKTEKNYIDILTLKKRTSQVNTLIVKNRAVTPLILVDGEEVVGGDQNRIINSTVLVDAQSEMEISVSCSEENRWDYKNEFESSDYIANSQTRLAKEIASRDSTYFQDTVWSSIEMLEERTSFSSPTKAMKESYENLKIDHSELIKAFNIVNNQNGVLIIINGEIKGFEIFLNSDIYKTFHEKIIKSYIIDCKIEKEEYNINIPAAEDVINKAYNSSFDKKQNIGLEETFTFENENGLGTLYIYKDTILHWSYFKKSNDHVLDEAINQAVDVKN